MFSRLMVIGSALILSACVGEIPDSAEGNNTSSSVPEDIPTTWQHCASEGETCTFIGETLVRFGAGDNWSTIIATGSATCEHATFEAPINSALNTCQVASDVKLITDPDEGATPVTPFTPTHGLYTQIGTDEPWLDVLNSGKLHPLSSQTTLGVVGSKIDVNNALVEVGPYANNNPITQGTQLHTVANANIDHGAVAQWSRWYQEDGNTQVFRLFKGEENVQDERTLAARTEVFNPTELTFRQAGIWQEFVGRFTILKAEGCGFEHMCSLIQTKGNNTDYWSVMLLLDGDANLWFQPRRGDAHIIARNMKGKAIDLRIRDNGLDYEMYMDGILQGTGQWERTAEIGFRWGIFIGASEVVNDVMIFVTGAHVFSSVPPEGYIFAANANNEVVITGEMDIAYGANGEFNYLYNQSNNVICDNNNFGDPLPGTVKQCFTRTSSDTSAPAGFTFIANEGETFNVTGTMDIAFGANGEFNYLYNQYCDDACSHLTLQCHRANFKDPIPGVAKKCYYKAVPATAGPSGYRASANENETVTVIGNVNIAYGANGQFKYLRGQTADALCNNTTFGGDPIPLTPKQCFVEPINDNAAVTPPQEPSAPIEITNGIKHPGMMSSIAQLNLLKKRYAQDDATTVALVGDLFDRIDRNGIRIRNPALENPEAGGRESIYCGSYNKGLDGTTKIVACDWPVEDGIDAYTFALLGYITGSEQYTARALQYMESWTNPDNFKGFDTRGSNAALQHGWVIPWYANAAEILRYTYAGWKPSHTTAMNRFIDRMLPLTIDDMQGAPNNWLHARIEAHISAAIWLSDANMLQTALNRWKTHTRSYIYINADNGVPVMPKSSKIFAKGGKAWDTNVYKQGLTLETCRDLNHQDLGLRSIFNSLVMAETQGLDILSGNDNRERLIAALKIIPRWTQSLDPHPDGICKNPVVIQGNDNTGRKLADEKVRYPYPLAYSYLHTQSEPLTLAKKDIDLSRAVSAARWVRKWEALLASSLP